MLGLAAGAVSAHRQLVQKSLLSSGNAELTALLASHKEAGSGGAGSSARSGHGELFFSSEVNFGGVTTCASGVSSLSDVLSPFLFFSSTLKVERGLGWLLLLKGDLGA